MSYDARQIRNRHEQLSQSIDQLGDQQDGYALVRTVMVVHDDPTTAWPPPYPASDLGPVFTVKGCQLLGPQVISNSLSAVAGGGTFLVSNLGNGTPADPAFAPTCPLVLLMFSINGIGVVYYSDHR